MLIEEVVVAIQYMNELTWKEISVMDRARTYCIIPISSLEQHGLHLPVGTDDLILESAIKSIEKAKIDAGYNLLILPPIKYGNSIEHMNFPGTVTLKTRTIISIIEDIVESLSINYFKNIICLNSHGGNTDLLHSIAQELRYKHDVRIYNIDLWASSFFQGTESLLETDYESEVHAGEIETSILKFTNDNLVKDYLCDKEELNNRIVLKDYNFSWLSNDISITGVIGDARASTADKGKKIVEYIEIKINKIINDILST